MFIKNVMYSGEKVVKVSIFDFKGKLERLDKWRTRSLWSGSHTLKRKQRLNLEKKNDENVV